MIRLTFAIFLLSAASVLAQSKLHVRAAEHPDYSRLIVPIDQNTDWVMSQEGRKSTVTFSGMRSQFALDEIFARMPRTRIVGVSSRVEPLGSALELTLNCSCDVTTSRIGSRFVAIDVKRSESAQNRKSAKRLLNPHAMADPTHSPPEHETTSKSMREHDQKLHAEVGAVSTPMSEDAHTDEHLPESPSHHEQSDQTHSAEHIEKPQENHEPRGPLDQIRDDLRAQLSSAAMEGLLEFSERPEAAEFADQITMLDEVPTHEDVHGGDSLSGKALIDLLNNKQIFTRSALDLDGRRQAGLEKKTSCTSDVSLNVARWTTGEPLIDELGSLRKEIVTEYGKVNKRAVIDLARLYILNGFGREAIAVLELSPAKVRDGDLLRELALIVEGRKLPENSILENSGECEGRISLWRTVAGLELLDQESDRGATILKAFSELPPELRRIAGDKIAGKSLDAGDNAAVSEVIGILDRTPGKRTPNENLVRAEHSTNIGEAEEAKALIQHLLKDEGHLRISAMLMEADRILNSDQPVPHDMISDLNIELRQAQETEFILPIYTKMAMLDSKKGRYFEALKRVDSAKIEIPNDTKILNKTARKILDSVPAEALEDANYARLILENLNYLEKDRESEALRRKFAKSLLLRGLPNVSLALLEGSNALQNSETRMLHAETLLTLNQPQNALKALGNLDSERAMRMRSQAHVKLGSISNAYLSLAGLKPEDSERGKYAVLSRNWNEVDPDILPEVLGNFANTMKTSSLSGVTDTDLGSGTQSERAQSLRLSGDETPSLQSIQNRLSASVELRNSTDLLNREFLPKD